MRINNVTGMFAWQRLLEIQQNSTKVMNQLSTGTILPQINVSNVAIAQKIRSQVEGYQKAMDNVYNTMGLLNTAEGGIGSITENLQRMRELALQAANGTLTESDRTALQEEFNQLLQGIDETVRNTEYNTIKVLAGDVNNLNVQTGANEGQNLEITIPNMDTENLGLRDLNISTVEGAQSALKVIDTALENVSNVRSRIGAWNNRLEHAAENLGNTMLNLTASMSNIEDADLARMIMEKMKLDILKQSTIGIMSQSNVPTMNVLKLLGIS
ncbi:MAG TPA: flagellin [Thermotogaceae bacterium]|nr:flagellin [Thermotogaceae bacterium]